MHNNSSKSVKRLLTSIIIVSSICITQHAIASENKNEIACKSYIQNKISWSYSENRKQKIWDPTVLDGLCKGTNTPEEPGKCFNKAMHGHVKWGISDKWEWKNAVSLCAGTDNSDERITCFQKRLTAGEIWEAGILQCQTNNGNLDNKVPM